AQQRHRAPFSRGNSGSAPGAQSPHPTGQLDGATVKNDYCRVDGGSTVKARLATSLLSASAAAAALAVSTSGCGSTSATLDPVARAAEATTHAGGARVSITGSVTSSSFGMALTLKGDGAFNFGAHE